MIIIGVDFHPEFQQITCVDTDTGEFTEQRLTHREVIFVSSGIREIIISIHRGYRTWVYSRTSDVRHADKIRPG